MNAHGADRFARWRRLGLAARVGVLLSVAAVTYAIAASVGWHVSGPVGLGASAVAAGVCLLGATLALVISYWLRDPASALYGMLFGMLFRMGIPLAFAVAIHLWGGVLAEAGVLYYLVAFYPVTLAVETALSLPPTGFPAGCPNPSQDAC
ncbi:MAG: hypothetical protein JXB62_14250 [Pirellulales bacterium]|nr:hypothetical protein [Pirellulales bacterium]